jgi:hypothetical protein
MRGGGHRSGPRTKKVENHWSRRCGSLDVSQPYGPFTACYRVSFTRYRAPHYVIIFPDRTPLLGPNILPQYSVLKLNHPYKKIVPNLMSISRCLSSSSDQIEFYDKFNKIPFCRWMFWACSCTWPETNLNPSDTVTKAGTVTNHNHFFNPFLLYRILTVSKFSFFFGSIYNR